MLVNPRAVFVNMNDIVYTASSLGPIYAWHGNDSSPWMNFTFPSGTLVSMFATNDGELFAGISISSNVSVVQSWTADGMNRTTLITTSKPCYGLFVDDVHRLYCSLGEANSVMMLVLNDSLGTNKTIAGGGVAGGPSTQLSNPKGIFVSSNYTLYVADYGNHRIQRFPPGQLNGNTVAGTGAPATVMLNSPSAVVLDGDDFMFIADHFNHRIVGEGPNGFRCIAGCSNTSGAAANQLSEPWGLSFDSHGNIFVLDINNHRIQKFFLSKTSCGKSTKED